MAMPVPWAVRALYKGLEPNGEEVGGRNGIITLSNLNPLMATLFIAYLYLKGLLFFFFFPQNRSEGNVPCIWLVLRIGGLLIWGAKCCLSLGTLG